MNGKPKNVRKSLAEKNTIASAKALRILVYDSQSTVRLPHQDIQPMPPKIAGCLTGNCLGCQNQTPHVHLLCAPAFLEVPRRSQSSLIIDINHPPKKLRKISKGPKGQTTKFPQKKLWRNTKIQQFAPKKWWLGDDRAADFQKICGNLEFTTSITSEKSKVNLPPMPHFP